jgi:uncharacterized protein (TIGR03435 family)
MRSAMILLSILRKSSILAAITLLTIATAAGQQPGSSLEVATVKRPDPLAPVHARMSARGGPGTDQPTHFECRGCPLALLIAKAYDRDLYQVSGSDWLMGDLFEVNAKVPENTSIQEFRRMLQALLAERFRLKVRSETRDVAGYELSVGARGSKLKDAGPPVAPPEAPVSALTRLDSNGFPVLLRGEYMAAALGHYRRHTQETIGELVKWLTIWLRKPVVDRTGLTGRYDITLSFVMSSSPRVPPDEPDVPGPTLVDAVRETGLRLVSKKVQVDYIVVESAQRIPAEN